MLKYKVYLDDMRQPPEGWVLTKTADETIEFLKNNDVEVVSLDHDLAFEHYGNDYTKEKTGYDVLLWIEEQVSLNRDFKLPEIRIHTANPSARVKMEQCLLSIHRRKKMRENSIKEVLEKHGYDSSFTQDGIDEIDLIAGKVRDWRKNE